LIDLWDFNSEDIPADSLIFNQLSIHGFDKISFDKQTLNKPSNIKLNFNSMAKGFIVDKLIDFFISKNVSEVWINAGGDIRFYSNNQKKWTIGIRHPRNNDDIIYKEKINDKAVATSGDYEKFFFKDNIRYHHILNAKTGFPENINISATIFANSSLEADALATVIFLVNNEKAKEILKNFSDVEAIIYQIDVQNKISQNLLLSSNGEDF
jgi:thiamine biosynthesis lipoprotein